jgi:hypothetical protein
VPVLEPALVIPNLRQGRDAASLLAYLQSRDEGELRVIGGDVHGPDPAGLDHAELARLLEEPVGRAEVRPSRPVWLCTIASSRDLPDPSDAQWAAFGREVLAAAQVVPDGDERACRWVALRSRPREVHLVATLVREDGLRVAEGYRRQQAVWVACQEIATRYATPYRDAPVTGPGTQELLAAAAARPAVTITREPSGSVVARGGDALAQSLLSRAGFSFSRDWHGPRHRLATTMSRPEQAAITGYALEMLRAARYEVGVSPDLDVPGRPAPGEVLGPYRAGAELLAVTDRIKGAGSGAELGAALEHLVHPEHGAVERLREALEAAGEQVTDLDDGAYELADRLGAAADMVAAAQAELGGVEDGVQALGAIGPAAAQVAAAASPAVKRARASGDPAAAGSPALPAPPGSPACGPSSRAR